MKINVAVVVDDEHVIFDSNEVDYDQLIKVVAELV